MIASHRSCHHANYHLDCAEFDRLVARAGGVCEICGSTPKADVRGCRLIIDHEHANKVGLVRGLLCRGCNVRIAQVDDGVRQPTVAEQRYLDRAWYATEPTNHQCFNPHCRVSPKRPESD